MKDRDYKILCELKKRLSQKIILLDMRIFGSRSRGDADDFSDFDVFIQTETVDRETKETIKDIAWKVGIENMAVISPLIFSRYDLTDSPLRYSPVVENIMKEGIRI